MLFERKGHKFAPAICYESLLPKHSENAFKRGADFYVASVAKSAPGLERTFRHFSETAEKYSMTVLMSNSVGPYDDFLSVGRTSIWSDNGTLAGQLDDTNEGILVFDTDTQRVIRG